MFEEYYGSFKKSLWSRDIPIDEFDRIVASLQPTVHRFKKNEYIIREDSPLDECMLVLRGEVLELKNKSSGERAVYNNFAEGNIIGYARALLPRRTQWMSDFIAKTNCVVMFFPAAALRSLLTNPEPEHIKLLRNIISDTARYLDDQAIAMRSLRNTTVRQKIANYLYEMYLLYGVTQFSLSFNREELAGYLNLPQSSLSREMSLMKKDGLINYNKSLITILDLERLKKI